MTAPPPVRQHFSPHCPASASICSFSEARYAESTRVMCRDRLAAKIAANHLICDAVSCPARQYPRRDSNQQVEGSNPSRVATENRFKTECCETITSRDVMPRRPRGKPLATIQVNLPSHPGGSLYPTGMPFRRSVATVRSSRGSTALTATLQAAQESNSRRFGHGWPPLGYGITASTERLQFAGARSAGRPVTPSPPERRMRESCNRSAKLLPSRGESEGGAQLTTAPEVPSVFPTGATTPVAGPTARRNAPAHRHSAGTRPAARPAVSGRRRGRANAAGNRAGSANARAPRPPPHACPRRRRSRRPA